MEIFLIFEDEDQSEGFLSKFQACHDCDGSQHTFQVFMCHTRTSQNHQGILGTPCVFDVLHCKNSTDEQTSTLKCLECIGVVNGTNGGRPDSLLAPTKAEEELEEVD